MNRASLQRLAARFAGAMLALAMLASPTLAQLTAAETCRARCERAPVETKPACCHDAPGNPDRSDHDRQSDSGASYCPGCGARALIASAAPLHVLFDAGPTFAAPAAPPVAHSADLSFSIFHPPRA